MQDERWKQIEDLFEAARRQPANGRIEFLRSACPHDPELLSEVESLLEAAGDEGSFLEGSPLSSLAERMPTVKPGDTLGHFQILSLLGRGGMGEVWRALDARLTREVAIKVLPSGLVQDLDRVARFEREARAASALNHPNIISVFDIGRNRGTYWIACELISGDTLRSLMEAGPMRPMQAVELATQVAAGLAAAHAAGLVHRDLKPDNIMVNRGGQVKILDFGLAKQRLSGHNSSAGDLTEEGMVLGTAGYMSPEQVRAEPADQCSDLFSFGVVLYEMLCGRRAFAGTSSVEVMNAILKDDPPELPPSVPPALGRIVNRCLEKSPGRRFQSAADLAFCLTNALNPAPAEVLGRGVWLRRAVIGGMAVLAAAAMASLWTSQRSLPRVTHITQMTRDGKQKAGLVTDGARLYYSSEKQVFQISVTGGEPVPMPALAGMYTLDISHDRSELLLVNEAGLWVAPVLGGAPRRLGDLKPTGGAAWSPEGDRIVYGIGSEIHIARSDGTESRKLTGGEGIRYQPRWSPDGRTIRFTSKRGERVAMWEIAADGGPAREMFPELAWQSSGKWTSDGKYFLFHGNTRAEESDLWALPERTGLLSRHGGRMRLTVGPMFAYFPTRTPDGRRIFFGAEIDRAELVYYDPKFGHWLPHLRGLAATQLDYSRDGKWVTYVGFPDPDVKLWRSAADGSDRLQLTTRGLGAQNPRWSPDGKHIAFAGGWLGKPLRVYVVSAAGGPSTKLTNGESGEQGDIDPSWSPDGALLVFSSYSPRAGLETPDKVLLRRVEVKTGRISILAWSQGLWSPRVSPDGRSIAALDFPLNHLALYDVETHRRTDLSPNLACGWPSWSRDGHFIYFEGIAANGKPGWYRVSVRDRRLERLAGFEDLSVPGGTSGWRGLAPDGSLLSIRDTGGADIYALDWEAP